PGTDTRPAGRVLHRRGSPDRRRRRGRAHGRAPGRDQIVAWSCFLLHILRVPYSATRGSFQEYGCPGTAALISKAVAWPRRTAWPIHKQPSEVRQKEN